MAARSYNRVMAEPALAGARLVATTLPGMAGAPITGDITSPALARHAADLAAAHRCDVVVGFSIGATIALEMVLSASFSGPVVLLGPSLTTADEDPFLRAVVRTAQKLGPWPMAALFRLLPHVAKSKDIPMSTSRYCSPTSRATEPATRFGPVLHISTTSALTTNRQNGSWRPASPHGWYTPRRATADSPTQNARPSLPPRS